MKVCYKEALKLNENNIFSFTLKKRESLLNANVCLRLGIFGRVLLLTGVFGLAFIFLIGNFGIGFLSIGNFGLVMILFGGKFGLGGFLLIGNFGPGGFLRIGSLGLGGFLLIGNLEILEYGLEIL